jgi:hypothetical protein
LVCDVQDLYRHLIDDFLIRYCQDLKAKDFVVKTEPLSRTKQGKRIYPNDAKTKDLMKALNGFFESYVDIPRRQIGHKQKLATRTLEGAPIPSLRALTSTWPTCDG